ncbi:MAG: hypothetical protein IJ828_02650 [Treponema sp.]|nr:hypothetical protein [Treponema sp.]
MNKKLRNIVWGVAVAAVLCFSLYSRLKSSPSEEIAPVEQASSLEVPSLETISTEQSSIAQAQEFSQENVTTNAVAQAVAVEEPNSVHEDGFYNSKEDVSLYIYTFAHLPKNYITKKEAQALGWPGGSLEPYAPGKSIGGDRFGNREGILPKRNGRSYTECDIDTAGKASRGAKRIVFSNDGLIYYTEDHYESFEKLYGDE